jgi:hypothetical protein
MLTTGEEKGRSTAKEAHLHVKKDFNWIVEFDRKGSDVVLYQYETKEMVKIVEAAGYKVGKGSYSDISDLWQYKVGAMNVGTGYYRAHAVNSIAILNTTANMVGKFDKFYRDNKERKIEMKDVQSRRHVKTYTFPTQDHDYGWGFWRDKEQKSQRSTKNSTTPEYATVKCQTCGRIHNWVKMEEPFICDCGETYKRRHPFGDLYYIDSKNSIRFACIVSRQMGTRLKCATCGTTILSPEDICDTEIGEVCSQCCVVLFRKCEYCGTLFLTGPVDDFGHCAYCEHMYT